MKYNKLKNSNIDISAIALGTWVFGGDVYGEAKENDCIDAVNAAIYSGITLIDTAPIYGYGRSEEIVGKAVKDKRDKVVIATKCGLIGRGKDIHNDLSKASIRKEVEDSLRRLNTDYIDIYQCHWPDPNTPIYDTMDTMNALIEEKKIRYIGVSNFSSELLMRANEFGHIVTLQSQYSMLERDLDEEILSCARKLDIGLLAYGPLAGGILSGKYKEAPEFKGFDARNFFYKYYKGDAFEQVNELLKKLSGLDHPMSQVAINWVRQTKGVASVIVGARNPEQVMKNAQACEWDLTDEEINSINSILDD